MYDLERIAKACGGAQRTRRGYKCLCPAHADRTPSLEIVNGRCALLVRCYAGCKPAAVLTKLRNKGLIEFPEDRNGDDGKNVPVVPSSPSASDLAERQARIDCALRIWHDARSAEGTIVEDYLRSRRLSLGVLGPPAKAVIRFHRACPRGESAGGHRGLRQPAMLALMRDCITDTPVAVHRRFLTVDGRKDGKPYTLGPVFGAAVKLSGTRETFVDELGHCSFLFIVEGVETGLAALALDYRPCWACGSTGSMKRFPVLPCVDELAVLADHDSRGWGEQAASACVSRWLASGKPARGLMWRRCGDLADMVESRHG